MDRALAPFTETSQCASKSFTPEGQDHRVHQIPLAEDSRAITTFITHRGLYRYKRLMFGVTSAPELNQRVVRDLLKTCAGVVNIADYIIVHGATVEEHDRHLLGVLDRLSELGLTLNEKNVHSG